MTDLSQMIRWNTNFVRGLAQSVLERAKVIRTSLAPYVPESTFGSPVIAKTGRKGGGKAKLTVKKSPALKARAAKKTLKNRGRKSKRVNA